jgi:hypothetical protein
MLQTTPAFFSDYLFDQHLPAYVRARARQYWTPVAVATRVGAIFSELGARKVLDVGSGPGKFCIVAGSTCPELELSGIEQRAGLIRIGKRLVNHFGLTNVQFQRGNATRVPWHGYDGFYFFNPFAENVFREHARFDDSAVLSPTRFGAELLEVERLLAMARVGTVVVTYHGLGGPIPASYELVAHQSAGSGQIRSWVQRSQRPSRWAWLEEGDGVVRVLQRDVRRALASLSDNDAM